MATKYRCLTCDNDTELSREDLIEHLINIHKLSRPLTFTRTPTLFLNGSRGYHAQHAELNFGSVKIAEIWESK